MNVKRSFTTDESLFFPREALESGVQGTEMQVIKPPLLSN